jgi:large subunit ribosomal protein L30e
MDINKALKTAVTTGQVLFGFDQTIKAIKAKKAKLVIISSNCPDNQLEALNMHKSVKFHRFSGTNIDLGAACGKPFSISILSVLSEGDSEILALGQNR